jgi:dTDP-4-amino-4,6-dideoxygalactose transaminase
MNFYSLVKLLIRFGRSQAKNILKLLSGYPLLMPPLGSGTLDIDDVAIAKKQLGEKKSWFDPGIMREYETQFAKWNGSKYAKAFMGGRVALSACIYALNLKPGDEVILPGYTCVVVPNAFHFAGVRTVYSDIELDTYGLDASQIEQKITPKTKAILLHHLYGLVSRDYEAIIQIARKYRLYVIEDCAQSTGAEFKGLKVGNLGDMAIYSSENSKVFTTIQGGMATTNDGFLAKRLEEYHKRANYPSPEFIEKLLYNVFVNYYLYKDKFRWLKADLNRYLYRDKILVSTTEEEMYGKKPIFYGMRMPSPIAAIGLNQLKKINNYNKLRRHTAIKWDSWCTENDYKKPMVIEKSVPVYLRYPVMVEPEKKQDTSWAIKKLKVAPGIWFLNNLHPSSQGVDGCPDADNAVKRCVNFPTIL